MTWGSQRNARSAPFDPRRARRAPGRPRPPSRRRRSPRCAAGPRAGTTAGPALPVGSLEPFSPGACRSVSPVSRFGSGIRVSRMAGHGAGPFRVPRRRPTVSLAKPSGRCRTPSRRSEGERLTVASLIARLVQGRPGFVRRCRIPRCWRTRPNRRAFGLERFFGRPARRMPAKTLAQSASCRSGNETAPSRPGNRRRSAEGTAASSEDVRSGPRRCLRAPRRGPDRDPECGRGTGSAAPAYIDANHGRDVA